jgi:hypothetical protein
MWQYSPPYDIITNANHMVKCHCYKHDMHINKFTDKCHNVLQHIAKLQSSNISIYVRLKPVIILPIRIARLKKHSSFTQGYEIAESFEKNDTNLTTIKARKA